MLCLAIASSSAFQRGNQQKSEQKRLKSAFFTSWTTEGAWCQGGASSHLKAFVLQQQHFYEPPARVHV